MGPNGDRQGNSHPENQSTEKPVFIVIVSSVYMAAQVCSALLGHYDRLTESIGVIVAAIFVAIVSIVLLLWNKRIRPISAFLLTWAVVVTAALVFLGNKFVEAMPITVSGTIVSSDQGDPVFACVEIYDKNMDPVTANRGSEKETGVFSVYNVPSGKYRLVVNGKWVSNFTVPAGYGKLFATRFSGRMNLEPEPVDVNAGSAIASTEEFVPFGNPDSVQSIQNSCGRTAKVGSLGSGGAS